MNVRERHTNQKLWALALAACVLLNTPLLVAANKNLLVMGIPLLYLYVFTIWAVIIGILYALMKEN